MSLQDNRVGVTFCKAARYSERAPFDPPAKYPEYTGEGVDPGNEIYGRVRDTLFRLGLDRENFGASAWNPFRGLIEPGMTVLIKPNTVVHTHAENKDVFSIIIHASIVRPILDYVRIALQDRGKIVVADSQLIFSDFDKAMAASRMKALLDWYRKQTPVAIECFDLRSERGVRTWLFGKWGREPVGQDARGYRFVDLGDQSCFKGIDPHRLRIAIADPKKMLEHHSNGKHEYLFPQSVLECDAVISIPKLKTHRRTALTVALKNFMGIPAGKDSLPHYMTGSPEEGGDQYIHPSLRKSICTALHDRIQGSRHVPVKFACAVAKKLIWNSHRVFPFKDDIYEGMWRGNDTLWRTLLDLNRAVLYADRDGRIRPTQQRKFFCVVDGVIGGQGNGPLTPDPVAAGAILAGFNPVSVDVVAATLMGFDVNKIPLIRKAFEDTDKASPLFWGTVDQVRVVEEDKTFALDEWKRLRNLRFDAHANWKGQVERTE